MKAESLIGTMLVAWMASVCLGSDIIPGHWEKLASQPSGTQLVILLKSGDRLEATLQGSTADHLTVILLGGGELRLAKPDIQRVEGEEYDDSNKEGTIIGLVGGFAFGAALGNSFNCSTRERCAAGYGAMFGGVGALVGYVLDKRTKQREVLFQAQ